MSRKPLLAIAFLATTLGATAAFASPPTPASDAYSFMARGRTSVWSSLGEIRVGGWRSQTGTLFVGRDEGRLSKLRIVVRDGDLGLKRVRITFGNGQAMDTAVNGRFAMIDLPGNHRAIRSIEVTPAGFNSRRNRAVIEVFGDRSMRPIASHAGVFIPAHPGHPGFRR